MNALNRLSIGQRMLLLVGGGTATVLGLMGLCIYIANSMYASAVPVAPDAAVSLEQARAELVRLAVISGSVGMMLVLPSFWFVTRSIVARLLDAQVVLERVTKGDLSGTVPLAGQDEVGGLLDGIRAMQFELTRVILQIRDSSQSMHLAIGEIAAGNQDLSQRTELQAASLQQTTANLHHMSKFLASNVESTQHADHEATEAFRLARQGNDAVKQLIDRMRSISEQSARIGDIISVIDGIAFQTNILALNASVESARAGEHGRGFAVVAGEVRMLAQRCGDAAKEIKTLINVSADEVGRGVEEAESAGAAMMHVVRAVTAATELIGKVSQTTAGQTQAVSELLAEVERMDSVTQQNAALVEQAAAAAQSVRQQSDGLVRSVSAFQITELPVTG